MRLCVSCSVRLGKITSSAPQVILFGFWSPVLGSPSLSLSVLYAQCSREGHERVEKTRILVDELFFFPTKHRLVSYHVFVRARKWLGDEDCKHWMRETPPVKTIPVMETSIED